MPPPGKEKNMTRLIGRLKIWQKFALVVALLIPLIAVPTVLVFQADASALETAQSEAAGIEPVTALIDLIQVTQQHRGLTSGMLSGDGSLKAQREARRDEVNKALARTLAATKPYDDAGVKALTGQLAKDWNELAAAVDAGGISPQDSLAKHSAVVDEEIELLDAVAASSQLLLDPEAGSYFLVTAVTGYLPRMTEVLGRTRARGVAVLARGVASQEERTTIAAHLEMTRMHFHDGKLALQRAMDADASLKSTLEKPVAQSQAAADAAIQAVEGNILQVQKLSLAPGEFLGTMTSAVDRQFDLIRVANESLSSILAARVHTTRREMFGIAAMIAALGLLAIWIIYLVSRITARSAGEALVVAEAMARGDLSLQVRAGTADEIGRVVTAIGASMTSLSGVVEGIRQSSEQVSTAASQIAAGNQDLSARTESQASSLQQTAASMEELTSTVKQSAEGARQASQLATSASEAATRGGEVVGRVVSTMNDITASSRRISEIISVIDGIAFQTNILALNAAVEAARAGDQGRGFAVVASEVRNLAQRSAQAAREIKGLITQSVQQVESGRTLVDDAGVAMGEIVLQVQRVTDLIAEISSAGLEQSGGIAQIMEAVNQMDQVTQQNAALVEESAAAAASLRQQADLLAQEVGVFRLRAGTRAVIPGQTRAAVPA